MARAGAPARASRCAQCGCFAFSCFEDFAIRVNYIVFTIRTPMPQPVPRYEAFTPSSETASRIKKRNKRKDTKSEVVLRKLVWRLGLRYRLHRNDLPGKPDLVFAGDHVAVFCDGDFWHGRNWDDRKKSCAKARTLRIGFPRSKPISPETKSRPKLSPVLAGKSCDSGRPIS